MMEQGLSGWEEKAYRIIRKLAQVAYQDAGNKVGKKHKPYTLPVFAEELIRCLGMHDRQEAEKRAKTLFDIYHEGISKDYGVIYFLEETIQST
jgi:hypothetical protein